MVTKVYKQTSIEELGASDKATCGMYSAKCALKKIGKVERCKNANSAYIALLRGFVFRTSFAFFAAFAILPTF